MKTAQHRLKERRKEGRADLKPFNLEHIISEVVVSLSILHLSLSSFVVEAPLPLSPEFLSTPLALHGCGAETIGSVSVISSASCQQTQHLSANGICRTRPRPRPFTQRCSVTIDERRH